MTIEKRKKIEPVVSWILAMILCPLGVCFTAKSGFGVSMIEAPVYLMYLKLSNYFSWYTFGTSEYIVQALLLIIMCIVIRRFKWKYLLSFGTAFLYGCILDGWNLVFSRLDATGIFSRIILATVGTLLTAFAVSMFFRTYLPLEIWELFVKEIAEKFGFNITKVKLIYDFSSLGVGIVLMFIFFGKFRLDAIGILTIVTTFVNAPIIGISSKLQDKFWDGITL